MSISGRFRRSSTVAFRILPGKGKLRLFVDGKVGGRSSFSVTGNSGRLRRMISCVGGRAGDFGRHSGATTTARRRSVTPLRIMFGFRDFSSFLRLTGQVFLRDNISSLCCCSGRCCLTIICFVSRVARAGVSGRVLGTLRFSRRSSVTIRVLNRCNGLIVRSGTLRSTERCFGWVGGSSPALS